MRIPLFILSAVLCAHVVFAEAVKDREGAVRKDKLTMENDPRWIYNDWQKGFAEAKREGRPVLLVLRCVPCLGCAGIDASVLTEPQLSPLLDRFVCVRVINANAIDLSLFQFDYDLSFSALMFAGDGTVLGRYGSWMHQKNPAEKTTTGFKHALEGALALAKNYPANKATLAGKQGGPVPFKDPLEIPGLAGKYKRDLDWAGKVVPSCVHCHQIGDAIRAHHRSRGEPMPSASIYPWPAPETIGLTLAADQVARVESVAAGSTAARAGLQAGDDLISMEGQPLVSIADVSWVLHRAPESGALAAVVQRGGARKDAAIPLAAQWRSQSDIARRVGTWQMRGMATGGLQLTDLGDEERVRRNLPKDGLALLVKHVGQYGKHAAAKNAGFQKDDVIVALAGDTRRASEGQVIGRLLQTTKPGGKVKATVLRGGQRLELNLPMQ
jgi:hypothetical protein